MTLQILFIRHAATDWNDRKRLQGRSDIDLSPRGRHAAQTWCLPHFDWLTDAACHASPLRRAMQTAALLTEKPIDTQPALIEADWGAFEGRTLSELRDELGPELAANEARGLDFHPPGGESPRQVRHRLAAWLFDGLRTDTIAVTHKGVIRAALSLACGWQMKTPPPYKLLWEHAHWMTVDQERRCLAVTHLNIPLSPPKLEK